jgi:putative ABC transport system permease protein
MPTLIGYVAWLSLRDFLHDRRMSLCHILGMAAVLAPLLILFGLKHGFIAGTTDQMVQNIDKRKLLVTPGDGFGPAEVEKLRQDPRVAFIVPGTRTLAAALSWVRSADGNRVEELVTIRPTGNGDPLFQRGETVPEKKPQVALTFELARQLGAQKGSVLQAAVKRRPGGRDETQDLNLEVVAVLAEEATGASSREILAPLAFLEGIEDYLDGGRIADFWNGAAPRATKRSYQTFRLHAKRLEDVPALHRELSDRKMAVYSHASEIGALLDLDRNLSLAYWVIALIGALGYVAALVATMYANVQRKRRDLAVLGQLGVTGRVLALFPIVQALLLALGGVGLSLLIYGAAALALNLLFASGMPAGVAVCRLGLDHAIAAVIATAAVTMGAAALSSRSVSTIDPAEVLREH